MKQIDIPLDRLTVSKLNARKDLHAGEEDSGIGELATSIKQQGLLSPLIVRPVAEGRYEVLVGHLSVAVKGFEAFGRLGFKEFMRWSQKPILPL